MAIVETGTKPAVTRLKEVGGATYTEIRRGIFATIATTIGLVVVQVFMFWRFWQSPTIEPLEESTAAEYRRLVAEWWNHYSLIFLRQFDEPLAVGVLILSAVIIFYVTIELCYLRPHRKHVMDEIKKRVAYLESQEEVAVHLWKIFLEKGRLEGVLADLFDVFKVARKVARDESDTMDEDPERHREVQHQKWLAAAVVARAGRFMKGHGWKPNSDEEGYLHTVRDALNDE